MATLSIESITVGEKEAFIQDLFEKAQVLGKSSKAFAKLSEVAAGRPDLPLARELFQKLDSGGIQKNG